MSDPDPSPTSSAPSKPARSRATLVRVVAILLFIVGLLLLLGSLPIEKGVDTLKVWIEGLGATGPIVFGAIYIVAVVAMLPGSALTLAAGAVFGLALGTLVVSIASTTGAALAFLIARYVARRRIESKIQAYPKFGAIDRALSSSGWKIVALLRLSPAVPFNLQNYLYGVTGIRFWTCVLTSWIAMLPGTLLYVYLGTAAGSALASFLSDPETKPWENPVFLIGLAVTIALTVYITLFAKRELAKQTGIESASSTPRAPKTAAPAVSGKLLAFLFISVAVFAGGCAARANKSSVEDWILSFFRPPERELKEAYEEKPDGSVFDHSVFDALLEKHVDDAGFVDYAALSKESRKLDDYITALGEASFGDLGRDEKLAFLINAYNAFTLKKVLENYPAMLDLSDVRDVLDDGWEEKRWMLDGKAWSLSGIEHDWIRPSFREPRIHFALVCAAVGCPPLRNEAYVGARLEAQLFDQTAFVHRHETWLRFDKGSDEVGLTALYSWYPGDFEQVADGSVLRFAARYSAELAVAIDDGKSIRETELPYSWLLNDKKHAVPR